MSLVPDDLSGLITGGDQDVACEIQLSCEECTEQARAEEGDDQIVVVHSCHSRGRWVATVLCPSCGEREPMVACDDHYDALRDPEIQAEYPDFGVDASTEWRAL